MVSSSGALSARGVALDIETEEDAMMRTRSRSSRLHVQLQWWRVGAFFALLSPMIAAPAAVIAQDAAAEGILVTS